MADSAERREMDAAPLGDDVRFDLALRPRTFAEVVGQRALVDNLRVFAQAAKARKEPLDHLLFCGPPGLGKTSLAHVIANEMGSQIHVTSGPALERKGDLAGILTNLSDGDVLFIDEIHRLNPAIEENLYPAMETYTFDIVIGDGAGARAIRLPLKRFTLIGATTRTGLLTGPLRDRFGIVSRLDTKPRATCGDRPLAGKLGVGSTKAARRRSPDARAGLPASPTGCSAVCATSPRSKATAASPANPRIARSRDSRSTPPVSIRWIARSCSR
jgi:Holliday junction DNA helicase RuvB